MPNIGVSGKTAKCELILRISFGLSDGKSLINSVLPLVSQDMNGFVRTYLYVINYI